MKGPELLASYAGVHKTRMGACFPGSHAIFRGQNLHTELKDMSWFELYLFGVTGRRFSSNQLDLLQALWSYTSYPDARIWNNRVAALSGTVRSTGNLGVSAALAVSEAAIYGRSIDVRAIDFLFRTKKALDLGKDLASCVRSELKRYRGLAGYGRPIASGDERLEPILSLARSLGLDKGSYLNVAYQIRDFLVAERWRLHINFGAVAAALSADVGLSTTEYYQFGFSAFLAGMYPCYNEATEKPEGATFPIACENVDYKGENIRKWPSSQPSGTLS